MLNIFRGTVVVFITMIISCVPLSPDRERPADFPHVGMRKVHSAGTSFHQGWNDKRASLDERPGMQTTFTYDYCLDTTEVTQKQYYEVTGRRPVSAGSQYGEGDNYPVYRVSWFDAVLYCNARSRSEGLDTVYVYSGIKKLVNGTVYELTGLWYDMTRDGYRLPTEAEWEYAAREGSSALPYSALADSSYACYYAWYGENSAGKTHLVGTRLPNSLGLYDMAGNIFEWTNDWKSSYNGSSITNPLGALQPGNEYEKVIKGGSYNYPQMYLRPSHRSATYATVLSSANEYVGFRCARGPVTNGQYIGVGQTSPQPPTIMTSGSDLRMFVGTSEAKLVFVNVTGPNRTLCYVDFSRTFPYVQEYLDDRNVYMPVISPDGRYVAYCSRNEGQSGLSKISIRSLDSLHSPIEQLTTDSAYIPRWWVDRQSGVDTFLIYTNSSCDNNSGSLLWPMTKTYRQKMSGGKPIGVPFELISDGSYHDGISVNGQYAVTGFSRLLRRDIFTGLDTQLFVSPENGKDKDAEGSTRVCNVSMSPDTGSGARCMFLDFGYTGTSTVTGTSYGIHQYLFVSNMSGAVTNFIHCPPGENSWDYTEWSNQVRFKARFAVGCGRNSSDQSHAIYAIDLENRSSKQLMTGAELQQPYLWLSATINNSILDSMGRYNDPSIGNDAQTILATKLLMFWRVFDSLEIAVIGSSQALDGIDPTIFTSGGLKAFNLAASGGDLLGQRNIILNYLLNLCPRLKIICSSLDIAGLGEADGNYLWKEGVGQSKGYRYDSCHAFWKNGVTSDFRDIINQIPFPFPMIMISLGFLGFGSSGWGDNPPPYFGGTALTWNTTDQNYQQNLATITMLADTLRNRRIHWIVIDFPVSPYYKNTDSYGFSGPSWPTARNIINDMQELDTANEFFYFYNANNYCTHDYGNEDAADVNHLSAVGATKLTGRVKVIINSIYTK